MRSLLILPPLACLLALHAGAQAPDTGPLVLLVPASTRATALGNAWVAGRDEDVVFYNPAQLIGARPGFNASVARHGSASTLGAIASVYAAGPMTMTLGWGVQFVEFRARPEDAYPYAPAILARPGGTSDALSMLAVGGGAVVYKGFRIGVAGKYASDRVAAASSGGGPAWARHDAFLGDVGLAHNLWTGVAGLSVQNIGRGWEEGARRIDVPLQTSLGWSALRQVGQLDLGLSGQVTARRGWISPGAGIEVGYGWIEGYSLALRAGARRTETSAERPVAVGASFNADRLTMEYALQFFDGGRTANRMTIRWR
jgi:hypothetical protein